MQTKLMQWGWGKYSENKAKVRKNTEFAIADECNTKGS